MTAPVDVYVPPPVDSGLSAAQIAAIIALVDAQARLRGQLRDTAVAAAVAAFEALTNWWSPPAVKRAIADALRVVQPSQRTAARLTDAYLARAATTLTGRTVRPAGVADLTRLRRRMSEQTTRDLVSGRRTPPRLELGDSITGPAAAVDDDVDWVLDDDDEWLEPSDAYGRAVDQYRFDVVAGGADERDARGRALVRIAAVASTDIQLAVREQINRTLGRIPGIVGYRRILRPELSESGPCGLCAVAAHRVYRKEDLMPIHDRCVPAGTRVAAEGVRALTRRRYSGSLVVLLTASGEELAITANHPVLTDQGWVPAYLVKEGDHVVRHRSGHRVVARSPDEGDSPPRVEDLWRAAVMTGTLLRSRVPVAPEDFHGDWSKGEVDVVSPYGLLSRVGDVSFVQPQREPAFVDGHRRRVALAGERAAGQAVLACGHPATGTQGGLDLFPAFGGSNPGVVEAQSIRLPTWINAGLKQAFADDSALDPVLLGQRLFRGTGQVLGDDLRVGQLDSDAPRFDPAFTQFAGEGRHTYAELGRNLRDRLAGHVELDRVVHQRRIEGTHEVYNLHTVEGWYSANSLIVSNCVCDVLPIIGTRDPGNQINDDDLRAMYEAAGSTGGGKRQGGALKRIRVVLTEHGELGPVLVDGDQHFRGPVDVARTQHPDRRVRDLARLEAFEERLNRLLVRQGRGEDVDRAVEWQTERVERLRRELGRSGPATQPTPTTRPTVSQVA